MIKLLCFLASAILTTFPGSTGRCPSGWWVNGIRPSGHFACYLTERATEWPAIDAQPTAVIESRIVCAPGTSPHVVDAATVGCTP